MPYKVTREQGETSESQATGIARARRDLGGSTHGEVVSGKIGEVGQEPIIEVESLTKEAEEQRNACVSVLQAVLIPHRLGKLTTREENQERLFSKLDRLTLAELMRFIPSRVKVGEVDLQSIPTNIRAEINMRYKEISP
ncbi:hypothetical protein LCGC14_2159100 [marine sediment metagenome]|uniref:Uncharacterized protein n=1 Tax=marine sediment metagenome TaxID=412755 RepID=A0A0F9EFJ2_9ZZZZ